MAPRSVIILAIVLFFPLQVFSAGQYWIGDATELAADNPKLSAAISSVALIETEDGDLVSSGVFIAPNKVLTSSLALAGLKCDELQIKTLLKQGFYFNRPPQAKGITAQCKSIPVSEPDADVAVIEVTRASRHTLPVRAIPNDIVSSTARLAVFGYVKRGYMAIATDCEPINPTLGSKERNRTFTDRDRTGKQYAFGFENGMIADCAGTDPELQGGPTIIGLDSGEPSVIGVFHKAIWLKTVKELETITQSKKATLSSDRSRISNVLGWQPEYFAPEHFGGPLKPYV
ncbi:MAG: hypothetical protein HY537_03280, partial [Deltaproteobacteria bacterium]|nr:hypothetical protein [Deltaproteobacteria bacterium]